ncbi:MAG: SNF2 helicase associated domain-containing protein [Cellulosilyticum sp.]|nr:SNF2 helicase associated domain-containing protein [Cellulosilyticum sp.]
MDWIKSYLKGNTDRGRYDSGAAMYQMGVVSGAYAKEQGREVLFYGNVTDEYRRQTYSALVRVDKLGRRILESSCDCQSIATSQGHFGLCAHAVAVAFKGIESLKQQNVSEEECVVLTPAVEMSLSVLKRGGFGMAFTIDGIDKSQYRKIFTAYKEKKKRFYLGEGHYLNLEEPNLHQALSLIDLLGVYNEIEKIVVPEEKALFLEQQLEGMDFVENRECVTQKLKKLQKHKVNSQIPEPLENVLRDYQKEGFRFLASVASYGLGGILADDMGLGKTLQVITFLSAQKGTKALVITPTALIYNWKKEIERFAPDLKVGVVHGEKNKRLQIITSKEAYDVILTTYHTYKNDEKTYEEIIWDYCIIDEAQQIKNASAQITEVIKRISSKVRFALTGTPMENNLMELWSIMDFVMPGYLYQPLRFRNIFMTEPPQIKSLRKLIAPFMLRRTKKEVLTELPDKIEQKVLITLEPHHRKAYLAMQKLIKQKLDQEEAARAALLAYLTKLRQICLMPEHLVKQYAGQNSKLEYLIQLLKEIPKEKVLIFSQFTTVLGKIGERLDEEGISYHYLDGKTEASERMTLVEDFNTNAEKRVFLISLKAGGTGLNLTSASTVIHFDPWWNPAVENQASDRAHRMGQKQVVNVIKLVAEGTIEERIVMLQEEKQDLIEQIMTGQAENLISGLSGDEIKAILLNEYE